MYTVVDLDKGTSNTRNTFEESCLAASILNKSLILKDDIVVLFLETQGYGINKIKLVPLKESKKVISACQSFIKLYEGQDISSIILKNISEDVSLIIERDGKTQRSIQYVNPLHDLLKDVIVECNCLSSSYLDNLYLPMGVTNPMLYETRDPMSGYLNYLILPTEISYFNQYINKCKEVSLWS
jgi:hypothetical protein